MSAEQTGEVYEPGTPVYAAPNDSIVWGHKWREQRDRAIALLREFDSDDGFCGEVPEDLRDRLTDFLGEVDGV